MKCSSLKMLPLLSLGLFFAGCEQHAFDETKGLHGDHGGHHEDHGDGHAADHGKKDHADKAHAEDHGKSEAAPAAHGEVKEAPKPTAEPRKTGL